MGKDKKRILLFVKIPPPITGATLMNQFVFKSELLKENFYIRAIKISYVKSVNDLGRYNFGKFFIFIKILFKLFNECAFYRPRLVYFQVSPLGLAFYRDLIFISIIKLFRIKIVFHIHGKGIKKAVENLFVRIIYRYAFRNSEIICLSHLLTYDIADVYSGIIHIVNNGIQDIDSDLIKLEQKNNNTIQILYLSNLIKSKGILDFIDALAILNKEKFQYNAVIVGAEADLSSAELQSISDEKELSNMVIYQGPKYGHEKYKILSSSDVLVFPTKMKHECFPLVIVEAFQMAIPVISTNEGAIPEIIDDNVNGFIVETNNPKQIAEKLKLLIQNPALRKTMGKAGRKKYEEKYTIRKFEENLLNVFNNVINSTAHSSEIKQNEIKHEL